MVHLSDEILFSNKGTSYNATKIQRKFECLLLREIKLQEKATTSEIPNI